jgi:hypothetical protein
MSLPAGVTEYGPVGNAEWNLQTTKCEEGKKYKRR